jgi:hypothetical protein
MDFDLGDFPHKGQAFYVSPEKFKKLAPDKVAKKIVQEINAHRNSCNRCGVPTPHLWSRQHGFPNYLLGRTNHRTGLEYTETDREIYDLPPDVLERKLHPQLSRWLDRRLEQKALIQKIEEEEERQKLEIPNPIDWVYNIPRNYGKYTNSQLKSPGPNNFITRTAINISTPQYEPIIKGSE